MFHLTKHSFLSFRNTVLGAGASMLIAASTAASTAAAAQPPGGLYWLVGEIRGQVAEVQARADAVLPFCDDADDVRRELDRLCRDLDRFEQTLARGIHHHADVAWLCGIAERIEDHACDLKDELADAIEDLNDVRRVPARASVRRFQQASSFMQHPQLAVHQVGYRFDDDDLEDFFEDRREAFEDRREALEERREEIEEFYEDRYDDLEDAFEDRRRFGRRGVVVGPRFGHAFVPQPQRGVRITLGRGGFGLALGGGPVLPPPPTFIGPAPGVVPRPGVVAGPAVPWQQVRELTAAVDRLHLLSVQLHRVLQR
ncbi:MAG: hypothetical protein AAF596_00045 [Planctomycetota bacterium]